MCWWCWLAHPHCCHHLTCVLVQVELILVERQADGVAGLRCSVGWAQVCAAAPSSAPDAACHAEARGCTPHPCMQRGRLRLKALPALPACPPAAAPVRAHAQAPAGHTGCWPPAGHHQHGARHERHTALPAVQVGWACVQSGEAAAQCLRTGRHMFTHTHATCHMRAHLLNLLHANATKHATTR